MRKSVGEILGAAIPGFSVCALLAGCTAGPRPGDQPDDGLERVEPSLVDELYVAPGVSLANYQHVMLDPVEIGFKDGWRKQHPDLTDEDYALLCQQLTDMLQEVLVAELARGGYTLAEAPARDVLRLRAAITEADFAAPEMNSDKTTSVQNEAQMTLHVQGFDAPSGALVARAKDREMDPNARMLERANRVTTLATARKIFTKWAQELRSALDVAKVHAGARQLQQ